MSQNFQLEIEILKNKIFKGNFSDNFATIRFKSITLIIYFTISTL